MISEYIKDGKLKVIIKPNSKKNEVIGFDKENQGLRISIKEPAEKDKANRELLKFITKETGKKASIKSGAKSKTKILEIS
ncbi:MAG: DUF167 domain-containing protein [Candidatus Nanoarchaeia archaeon]